MRILFRFIVLPAVLIVAAGCGGGGSKATLSGKVLYKGQPVTGGSMILHYANSGYPVTIDPDGSYAVNQLPLGEVTATVDTENLNPKKPTYGGGKGKTTGSPAPAGATQVSGGTYVKVPTKYAKMATSDLKLTIKGGRQEHTFELKD